MACAHSLPLGSQGRGLIRKGRCSPRIYRPRIALGRLTLVQALLAPVLLRRGQAWPPGFLPCPESHSFQWPGWMVLPPFHPRFPSRFHLEVGTHPGVSSWGEAEG